MSNAERLSASITLSEKNPFDLTMQTVEGKHSLAVMTPVTFGQGTSKETQDLMRAMMAAHLLGPTMPETIETNFDFHFSELLNSMYEYYGKKKPTIKKMPEQMKPQIRSMGEDRERYEKATAHSGGLDSVYRIAKLLDRGETPLAVHLKNLNASGNARESSASKEQCVAWKVPYVSIQLRNGSGSVGVEKMKTRDLLLALSVAVETAPNKIKTVLIEGGMGTERENCQFSENADVWKWFNKLLKETGLDVEVEGVDPGDIETIGEIIELEKKLKISILPMVQNCFTAPFRIGNSRRRWQREAPEIAGQSSYHWCGSCFKCRRMTLGRLFYHDPRFAEVSERERRFFVDDTYKWMREYPQNLDFISESFRKHLEELR
jgi:hypothetical protein